MTPAATEQGTSLRSTLIGATVRAVVAGGVYYGAAKLGLQLSLVEGTVTPLWPPSGIAVVAFLVFGYRIWPGIAVAAFAVNVPTIPALGALGIAAGNTVAPMIACWLLHRVGFRRELDRTRDALALVVLGALGAMLVSSSGGTASLLATDVIPSRDFLSTWLVWWAGDAMGVLAVVPFLLALGTVRFSRPVGWGRILEGVVLFAAIGGSSYLLRTTPRTVWVVLFPLLGLVAWRFRQRGAAPAALAVMTMASWAAADNLGPFSGLGLVHTMVALQAFNAAVAFTSFFFAAVVAERARAERALASSAAELEHAVQQRTFELQRTNRRLELEIRERHDAEKELRRREAQLAEAQEVARLGSWEWDVPGDVVRWSDELYLIYGLDPQSIPVTYEGFIERVHPADRDRTIAQIERSLSHGTPLSFEHRIVLPDGSERTLYAQARVVTDDGGDPIRLVGTAQDITEQADAVRALRQSEEVFRGVFESAAIGMAQCDPDGTVRRTNPAFRGLLEASEAALDGAPLADLVHAEDAARFRDLFGRLVAGTLASFEIEMRFDRPGPETVWISASIALVRDADDQPRMIQVIAHDLSERRRAEALARAEAERGRLRAMFSQVPAAVVVTRGPDHRIEFANDAFHQLVGPRDCVDVPVRDALPEMAEQGYLDRLDEVFTTGRSFTATEALVSLDRNGDGTVDSAYVNLVLQPLRASDGRVDGILMHAQEVSEAVRSRLQLSESLAFLDTLLATAPAGFAVFDDRMRYARINERLAEMNGQPAELHVGRTPREMVPDHAEAIERILEKVRTDRLPVLDVEISRPSPTDPGQIQHWLASFYPIENRDGAMLGIGSVVVDITERKRVEDLLAAQKDILEVVARGTDLTAALEALARLAEEQSAGDVRASVLLLTDGGTRLRHGAAPSLPADYWSAIDGMTIGSSGGSCGAAAALGRPVIVADIATHPNWASMRHLALRAGLRAAWSAPIVGGDGAILGTFCMYCTRPRAPSPQEQRLLEVLTQTAGIAIQRQRAERERQDLVERERQAQLELYEREHRIAETLQRSLLPGSLPVSPDVAVAARYIPASDDVEVGGDWYDFIPLPDGRLGLAIGDVAGHGIGAAASMGQLRMALRAYALEDVSPAEALVRLNNLLIELQPGAMATLVYGQLDPETGAVRIARAGHPPPLVVRPDGAAELIEGGLAPPLGVVPLQAYAEATFDLATGSTLLLYTDGLIERRGEAVDDGLSRLQRVVADAPADLDAACDHIVERLLSGMDVSDDTALLAARRVSLVGAPLRLHLPTQPARLGQMRRVLRRWLLQNGFDEEEAADVTIACTEACSNAMQHAYGSSEGWMDIEGAVAGDQLSLTVRDHGSWRSPDADPSGEGGRGLRLMQGLMDSVEVVSGIDGTEVKMRRRAGELVTHE